MATQERLDTVYMDMANSMSTLSHGKRAKVGAVAVTANGVVITGVNGLPKHLGNKLEHVIEEFNPTNCSVETRLETKDTVIHAENAILVKCAREGISLLGSTVYVTMSCCNHCASMLASSGVVRVVYLGEYRDLSGINTLKQCGVIVDKFIDIT